MHHSSSSATGVGAPWHSRARGGVRPRPPRPNRSVSRRGDRPQNGAVPDEYDSTDAFRGAVFRRADLTGAAFRDCDFSGVRIVGANLTGLRVDGYVGKTGVVVNDVDVTAYVETELDRRHPEREPVREARTAEEIRDTWTLLEELWADTLAHAERLTEAVRQQRVEEEWSFVETLRHLVMAVDIWIGRMVLGDPAFHPLGLPMTEYPPDRLG